jgi:branched-chain amino acid transport system permease protein
MLGLAESYTIWKLPTDVLNKVKPALPIIFLYLVLLILPQARLSVGRVVSTRRVPRVATLRESIIGATALVLAAVIFVHLPFATGSLLIVTTQGIVFSLVMLSLVLLVGYAGQTSLAQMTFVGLGAFVMGKYFGGASLWGLLFAALFAGAVGALAALPALRLQGLYLALSTFAFAQGMSTIFFKNEHVFGYGGRLAVGRPSIPGVSFESDKMFLIFVVGVFALAGMAVVAIRRGPFGRRLVAMKDSSAACATLGLNLTFTKLAVFALSASIAGVAGCLYGGVNGQVGPTDFEPLNSLVVLLLVSIAGICTVTGAFMGGLTFGLFKYDKFLNLFPRSARGNFPFIGAGLGAMGIGRNPMGWTSEFKWLGDIVHRVIHPGSSPEGPPESPSGQTAGPAQEVRELAGTSS